jgi:hypothetical protein
MTDPHLDMALHLFAADAETTYRDAQACWPALNAYQRGVWLRMAHAALHHAPSGRPTADRAVKLFAAHCGYTLEAAPALYAAAHPSVRRYWERMACV